MGHEQSGMGHAQPGRLSRPPHPVLFELLYEPGLDADRRHVLPFLLQIDAAHVVMLAEQDLLPRRTAAQLLAVNRDLEARRRAGEDVLGTPPSHRGLYLLYESLYVERLGPEVGGAAHLARSRNDINATVYRLRLRRALLAVLGAATSLADTQVALAERHSETEMSAFTHLQPAQPSTFGHYLAGVSAELMRSLADLAAILETLDHCPLGACAGFGTSLPIDRRRVAELLGFSHPVANSLDAVASRDDAVRTLAAAAQVGVTLTRLATDLQSWASPAYGFFDWPDDLVSTSSIMPQKRNAYVLENIRGRAVAPLGALSQVLAGLKNTPFSNSVEAGSESVASLWSALTSLVSALRLADLLLTHIEVRPGPMQDFLARTGTTMTALADYLVVRHGLAFRTAHDVVGSLVSRHGDALRGEALARAVTRLVQQQAAVDLEIDGAVLDRLLTPSACVRAARYGGGPAPEAVREQLAEQRRRLADLTRGADRWRGRFEEAASTLTAAVGKLIDEETP